MSASGRVPAKSSVTKRWVVAASQVVWFSARSVSLKRVVGRVVGAAESAMTIPPRV